MKNKEPKLKLYHATDSSKGYDEVIKAASPLGAARVAFDHAAEIGANVNIVSISPLVEPEDGGPGLCYEANHTDTYAKSGGRIRRHHGRSLCERCSSPLNADGFCLDETCPFSDHKQPCPVGWTGHPNCPFGQRDGMIEDCTCGGRIGAEVHSDDRRAEADFSANKWFEQAGDEEMAALAECDWGGDYPADAVAEFMKEHDGDVAAVFEYLDRKPTMPCTGDTVGFECHVNEHKAMRWLRAHKPDLYTRLNQEGR